MAKATIRDSFANVGYASVVETAANTLTFAEIQTNVSVFEKTAWVLHRIEWYLLAATKALLVAADDLFTMGLTASRSLTALGLNESTVIDLLTFQYGDQVMGQPLIRDFSNLPGGGKIIPARPLFCALKGTSVAAAGSVNCRFLFTMREVTPEDYYNLLDFYRIVTT